MTVMLLHHPLDTMMAKCDTTHFHSIFCVCCWYAGLLEAGEFLRSPHSAAIVMTKDHFWSQNDGLAAF